MVFRRILRWAEIFAAVWWAFALTATGLMLIFAPEGDQYPKPTPDGCFFASDLIVHVMCNRTWNDGIIGGILSWALYWTFESPIVIPMMAVSKTIFGIGIVVLWLASLLLALSFLTRQIRKVRQKPKAAPLRPLALRAVGAHPNPGQAAEGTLELL